MNIHISPTPFVLPYARFVCMDIGMSLSQFYVDLPFKEWPCENRSCEKPITRSSINTKHYSVLLTTLCFIKSDNSPRFHNFPNNQEGNRPKFKKSCSEQTNTEQNYRTFENFTSKSSQEYQFEPVNLASCCTFFSKPINRSEYSTDSICLIDLFKCSCGARISESILKDRKLNNIENQRCFQTILVLAICQPHKLTHFN